MISSLSGAPLPRTPHVLPIEYTLGNGFDIKMKSTLLFCVCFVLASIQCIALTVFAQPPETSIRRIVVLSSGESTKPDHPILLGFRDGLARSGYVEGVNLVLTIPSHTNYDALRATAKQYRGDDKVDLFVTIGSTDTTVAKEAGLTVPVLFMPTRDPLGRGLVKSLARPQTNFTGLAYEPDEGIAGKELEVFKSVVPRMRRVLVLFEHGRDQLLISRNLPSLRNASRQLKVTLIERPLNTPVDGRTVVSNFAPGSMDGIFVLCTNFFTADTETPGIARREKIPYYGCPTQVRKFGALVSYAPDFFYIGRRAAWYADRILKGSSPSELPVETPRKFELMINLQTANMIGLKIPPESLQLADKVIR